MIETLRAEKEFFGPRPALGGHIRIPAVPLERFGSRQILQRAVINDVLTETVRLEIPLQSINRGVDVAVGAAKSTLEGKLRSVEKTFAPAQGVDVSGTSQIPGGDNVFICSINHRNGVIQTIGYVQALAVGRKCHATRVVPHGNSGRNIVRRGGQVIDKRPPVRVNALQ